MLERDLEYQMDLSRSALDEMEKISVNLGSVAKWLAKRPGTGTFFSKANIGRVAGVAGGAGAGAGIGAATAPPEERGQAALGGALVGGTAGLGVGQLATGAGRRQVLRFGQRQLHSITGYRPGRGLFGTKGMKNMTKAERRKARLESAKEMRILPKDSKRPAATVEKEVERVNKARAAEAAKAGKEIKEPGRIGSLWNKMEAWENIGRYEAAKRGLTSVPGFVKGMATDPVGTVRTGVQSAGVGGLALTGALGASAIPGMVRGEGWGSEYSKPGGAGKLVGESIGWGMIGTMPLTGALALGSGIGELGAIAQRSMQRGQGM